MRLDASQVDDVINDLRSRDLDAYRVLSQYTGAYEYDIVLACIDNPEGAGAQYASS